jgi:hypothetical protein
MSKLYDNAKTVTLKAVRALYPGCRIEAYFVDEETPTNYIVVERPDAHASVWDVKVVPEEAWKNPKARREYAHPSSLNTDRWTLLGEAP